MLSISGISGPFYLNLEQSATDFHISTILGNQKVSNERRELAGISFRAEGLFVLRPIAVFNLWASHKKTHFYS
jgi:hypothetical protein